MMERLDAEERLAATTTTALARFMKGGAWVNRQMAAWRRAAAGWLPARKAAAADLAAIGIGVRAVKRDG